jgi:predicted lipoprotein with Yx(FWY)xxD motif
MNSSQQKQIVRSSRRRTSGLAIGVTAVTLAFAASLAAMAFAVGAPVTVTSASNAKLDQAVTVDTAGQTLYVLSPETTHHLLCKSRECLKFWPPLTVRSAKTKLKAGPGVHGRLGILHRSNGTLQVTLGGLPLYRYAGDHAKGEANGQSLHSFGGTWHVLSATSAASPAAPMTSTTAPATAPPAPAPAPPTTSTPPPTTPAPAPPAPEYGY